jgi:hypothetical protein
MAWRWRTRSTQRANIPFSDEINKRMKKKVAGGQPLARYAIIMDSPGL